MHKFKSCRNARVEKVKIFLQAEFEFAKFYFTLIKLPEYWALMGFCILMSLLFSIAEK